MPELPEVETIKRDLEKNITGCTISAVKVLDERVIQPADKEKFVGSLKGRLITRIIRRGKSMMISFEDKAYLFVQLRMTGQFVFGSQSEQAKVVFALSNGEYLSYNDQRTLGWLIFVKNLDAISFLNNIGPEPLGDTFSVDFLREGLKRRIAPIKTLLMNQNFLAGIGNIYASEILFAAKINPGKSAKRLTRKEINGLHQATINILKEAIECRGTSMRDYRDGFGQRGHFINRIKVYGRENQACLSCGSMIKRIVQAGRSTFYCRSCQT